MTVDLSSLDAAEAAFYQAFERGDYDAMVQIWDDAEDVICAHPLGPTLAGANAVMRSWKMILSDAGGMQFTPRRVGSFERDGLAITHVHEHISRGEEANQRGVVIATNAYRLRDGQWRMIMHQGGPVQGAAFETPQAPTALH